MLVLALAVVRPSRQQKDEQQHQEQEMDAEDDDDEVEVTMTVPVTVPVTARRDDLSRVERQAAKRAARKATRKARSTSKAQDTKAGEAALARERQHVLRDAELEAEQLLEEARAYAEALQAEAAQSVAELEASRRSELESERKATSQRAELMAGHSNVARALLSEELRLLDDDWRADREDARLAEEESARQRTVAAQSLLDDAAAHKEAAERAEAQAKRVLADAKSKAAALSAQAEAKARAAHARAKKRAEQLDDVDDWTSWALDVEENLEQRTGSKAARRAGRHRDEEE